MGLFDSLKKGLEKTRNIFTDRVNEVFKTAIYIDDDMYDELEEVLITSDIGVTTSEEIIEALREKIRREKINEVKDVKPALKAVIGDFMNDGVTPEFVSPSVYLIIGVNGVGKTTSLGKLANKFKKEGKKVVIVAADTFRAAAIDQVQVWADRSGVDIVKHQEGSDPASVVYDGIRAAKARKADILLIDTAGRLHNKKNLMAELEKINRIIEKEFPEAHKESLLVLDATTGQNALNQAKEFQAVTNITGLILTKLDGTAKGGVVLSIKKMLNVPVKYIGVGEGIDDIEVFSPKDFGELFYDSEVEESGIL